ncbi:MAG TPA: MotA/TolQ/ExbB proton channel family protein, partial [Gemmatimonadaceae bacterium]|nr:MotA/TolQ/ExbB proton channel family protein [Gemmatimonadaceae bacterium]
MDSVVAWYRSGGPMMHVILFVAVIGLAVVLERFYMIVLRSKINGRAFIERIIQLVRAGKVDEAIKLCAQSKAALPDMGLLILRSRSRDEADLQNVADAAALSVIPRLTRRLHYLPMLANVATLLGLLGTILGLREAFMAVGAADAAER